VDSKAYLVHVARKRN